MFTGALLFLSNFDTTPFEMPNLGGMVRSGEHAFNALKTTSSADRHRILSAATPGLAKRAGRRVELREGWDDGLRVRAMQAVLLSKFQLPELREQLDGTGSLHLVETNRWHDQFWGDCFCGRPACARPGVNMLGELLMALRAKPLL
jgi:ribA/ribD-fused uncharacterized protein